MSADHSSHDHGSPTPEGSSRPVREERQPAEDDIRELAPGVRRLQLPINFTGLGHVNCYILEDADGFAVVDPGLPGREAWKQLVAGLKRADVDVKHVHSVVVTHSHPDHFGQAGRLRRETGARVITHRSFRMFWDKVEDDEEELADVDHHADNVPLIDEPGKTPWGGQYRSPMPRHRRLVYAMMRRGIGKRFFPTANPTHRVDDAQEFMLAGRPFQMVHTPGHTIDHLCLHDPEHGLLIAGDHVLPTITPHISGMWHGRDPLRSYFDSLDKVAEQPDVSLVLPAHGQPFTSLRERTEAIKEHHRERLDILREASDDLGPAPVEEYMKRLFQQRSWGPMAESETFAHLEHLRYDGEATISQRDDGQLLYTFS